MKTIMNQYDARFAFIDSLSAESIAISGRGIYVYMSPLEIEQLYGHFQDIGGTVRDFARQCVRAALGR